MGKNLKIIYQDFINQELKSPEVRQAKMELIQSHFSPAPIFILRPFVFVPALGFAAVFAGFLYFQGTMNMNMEKDREIAIQETLATYTVEKAQESLPEAFPVSSHVMVKRLSSSVGSTLVYQKPYNGNPITILWVFPATGPK